MPRAEYGSGVPVKVHRNACLSIRFGHVQCAHCVQACPTGAISIEAGSLSINDACLACGRCAAVCPTSALKVAGFTSLARAGASIVNGAPVVLDCQRVPRQISPDNAVRVPCLGGISVSELLNVRVFADDRSIRVLDRGWCRNCPAGGSVHAATDAVAAVARLFAEMGLDESLWPRLVSAPPSGARPAEFPTPMRRPSRRDFFRRFAHGAAHSAVRAQETRPARVEPAERVRTAAALRMLAARYGVGMPASFFPRVAASGDCRNHGVCAGLCPTGALFVDEDEETSRLLFDTTRCIACGQCAGSCPANAIRVDASGDGADGGQPVVLARHSQRTCFECGGVFAESGEAELCPACRKNQEFARAGFAQFGPLTIAAVDSARE